MRPDRATIRPTPLIATDVAAPVRFLRLI